MGGDNLNIQVLNISNVNAQGKVVLNDGKLLELIQKYPFLYNRRVKSYNDSDYVDWAWKNINAAFNCSYDDNLNAAFSIDCLKSRWNVLKTLIQCLSKAYDMEAIPQSLRNSVINICMELDDTSYSTSNKPNNSAQNLLLLNMSAIAKLPIDKRLALEKDVLNVILSAEIESKPTTELKEADWKNIYEDAEEFLNDIGYKKVILTAIGSREKIFYNNYCNQYTAMKHAKSRTLGWMPLNKVKHVIKPCAIRVRRLNLEDYLPLSQIIQMNKMKSFDSYGSHRESPGIFGT